MRCGVASPGIDFDLMSTLGELTMIVDNLTVSQAADRLLADDNASWSYEGARALCEYLDDLGEDCGKPVEFDVVGVRCEFSEYETAAEALEDHDPETYEELKGELEERMLEELEEQALEALSDRRTVIVSSSGSVVVSD